MTPRGVWFPGGSLCPHPYGKGKTVVNEQQAQAQARKWATSGKLISDNAAVMIARMWLGINADLDSFGETGEATRAAHDAVTDQARELRNELDGYDDGDQSVSERVADVKVMILEMDAVAAWINAHSGNIACACERNDWCRMPLVGLPGDLCDGCVNDNAGEQCRTRSSWHCDRVGAPLCDGTVCEEHEAGVDRWVAVMVTDPDDRETEPVDGWFTPGRDALGWSEKWIREKWVGAHRLIMWIADGTGPVENAETAFMPYRAWNSNGRQVCTDYGGVCDGGRCERHMPGPGGWINMIVTQNGMIHSTCIAATDSDMRRVLDETAKWACRSKTGPVRVETTEHDHAYGAGCECLNDPGKTRVVMLGPGHCISPVESCDGTRCRDHLPGDDEYGEVTVTVDGRVTGRFCVPDARALARYCSQLHDTTGASGRHVQVTVVWHPHAMDYDPDGGCDCGDYDSDVSPWQEWNNPV